MSFWSADEKIPVQQTKVSIPAEHGLNYEAGQKINIHIPPTIKYFQPKESYLAFEVELENPKVGGVDRPVRLTLDGETGAQCLIRDIRIHSGGSGAVLLEEIQGYNTLCALRYDYESNDAIKEKRALTEGVVQYTPTQRGTYGQTKTGINNTRLNPYSTPYKNNVDGTLPVSRTKAGDGDKNFGEEGNSTQGSQYNKVKCLLPLHTGIFSSGKVFPALLTEGLRLEIILEDANKVLRLPDQLHPNRKTTMGLQFHSTSGKDNEIDHANGVWTKSGGKATDTFYVQRTNNMIDLENCPLVIGQRIALYKDVLWADQKSNAKRRMITDKDMVIKGLRFVKGGNNSTLGGEFGLLEITLTESVKNSSDEDVGSLYFVKDNSILECSAGTMTPASTTMTCNYKVKNTELILQTLTMPQGYTQKLMSMMGGGGAMNYDFLSYTNYKFSQLKGDRVMNMRLPLNQTKAKSILCVPTDSQVYTTRQLIGGEDTTQGAVYNYANTYPAVDMPDNYTYVDTYDYYDRRLVSNRSGLVGIADEATDYQFFYNGQLNPSRLVDLSKISRRHGVQQQPLVELEKALAMGGINPLSFAKFQQNFCIGRALALQQGVYNTAGRDFNLQVNYQGTTTPKKNKLWNNYVAHIRRLMVQGDAVVVQI